MARINHTLLLRVDEVASNQLGLVTSAQLVEIGFAYSTIRHRARQGGPWRRLLPGVYLVAHGTPTEEQRVTAAWLYVGRPALLTAGAALRRYGIRAATDLAPDEVHLLVPHERRRASTHFVHVQRSRHWPADDDGLTVPAAPIARAALDGTRTMTYRNEVAAVLTEVVRDGHASLDELRAEYRRLQRRRSALAGDVLRSMEAGVDSAPEDDLFRRWQRSTLPSAIWNVDLYVGGQFLARPDAYVVAHGVAVEVDSQSHHWSADDWRRTMERHARMAAQGLIVLHVPPGRIRDGWEGLCDEIWTAVHRQRGRDLSHVRVAG